MVMTAESRKLRDIISLDAELNRIQDLDILLERILFETRKAVGADAGSIYIKKAERSLEIRYSQNDTLQKRLPHGEKLIYSIFTVPIDTTSISGYAAATGSILRVPDMYAIPSDAPYRFNPMYDRASGYRTISSLTAPLRLATGEILGVIQVINKRAPDGSVVPFLEDDELFVNHFAVNATVALQRAQMTRTILLRMIRMAELRDPKETGPHVNRVAAYSVELFEAWARKINMPTHELERLRDTLRMAAMLHDVGKIAISDVILKKPGKFDPSEFETIKRHTFCGAQLFVDRQSEFDEIAAEVALTHHENWDGSGYPGKVDPTTGEALERDQHGAPRGLKGEEIPLWGRIVAIADVYDALSTRRVYKDAWREEDVLTEIQSLSGKKFQPELVDLFFQVLPNIRQATRRYPEP